jgi:23S rRNA pseudouridine1911/1915/1917 synthase
MAATPGEIHLVVEPQDAGVRLDAFLALRGPGCSRSQAAEWIRQGIIRTDGQAPKPSHRVRPGEVITGVLPAPVQTQLTPEAIAFTVLFEDRDLIVVNKPPGLVVHPAAGHARGTLVNGLLHLCPDLAGIGGERRPGIVHRLDKDTSGVMVVAKNDQAHQVLSQYFKERLIEKTYWAIVVGCPKQAHGTIDLPVGRHPVERKKMSVASTRGRSAVTLWEVQERWAGAALLALGLKTGRTHQIRVHCQAMGHPIVGDPVYGPKRAVQRLAHDQPELYQIVKKAQRQMLHAARLAFAHPISGQPLSFKAPVPEDMALILADLRQTCKLPSTRCP